VKKTFPLAATWITCVTCAAAIAPPGHAQQYPSKGAGPALTDLLGGSPERFAAFLRSEQAKWSKVVKDSGVRLD
jgi:tripartite-type tricarboxylate transporter receptor subunit TctC